MSDLRFQSFTNEDDETSQYSGRIGDKAQANRDGAVSGGFRKNVFSLEFYQQYFDVDTDQVFSRILHSMNPMRGNFITESIQPIPDLYGPFWISVTLIFVTGIFGNIAQYIESGGQKGANGIEGSDFRMVTGASSLVMSYVILVPAALYCLLWYRKVSLHYSYLEILSAYGYSLAIFIPVSVAIGTVFGILLLHFLLAICFKEYFFDTAHPAVAKATASLPSGDLPPTVVNPQAGAVNDTAHAVAAAQVKDTKSNETKSVEEKSAEKKTDESEDKNKKPDENFPKNQSVRRPKGKDEKTPKPT